MIATLFQNCLHIKLNQHKSWLFRKIIKIQLNSEFIETNK